MLYGIGGSPRRKKRDLIIFRWCIASFDSAWHLRYCSRLQTHKCAEMIPSSWVSPCIPGCNVASEDAQCISGTWARCRIFSNIFDRTVSEFFAEPEPEIKTSLTYTTATFHSVEKSALAQGLSAPHHHSLAPSSITISSIPQTTEQLVTSHFTT